MLLDWRVSGVLASLDSGHQLPGVAEVACRTRRDVVKGIGYNTGVAGALSKTNGEPRVVTLFFSLSNGRSLEDARLSFFISPPVSCTSGATTIGGWLYFQAQPLQSSLTSTISFIADFNHCIPQPLPPLNRYPTHLGSDVYYTKLCG